MYTVHLILSDDLSTKSHNSEYIWVHMLRVWVHYVGLGVSVSHHFTFTTLLSDGRGIAVSRSDIWI